MSVETKWNSPAQITCTSSAANADYVVVTQKKKLGAFSFWKLKPRKYQIELACPNRNSQAKSREKRLTTMK